MKIFTGFVLIWVCLAKSSAIDLASGHSFFAALDESQKVKLYWNVDTAKKEISFTVEAQTTGGSALASPVVRARWREPTLLSAG